MAVNVNVKAIAVCGVCGTAIDADLETTNQGYIKITAYPCAECLRNKGVCVWGCYKFQNQEYWETSCGHTWQPKDYNPPRESPRFCEFCGRMIDWR